MRNLFPDKCFIGRVLLILDNAPSHPCEDTLERENGKFRVKFLPPNVTSLIQPMDQSVIETFKRPYRKQMLRKLLLTDETEDSDYQHTKIDMKDCCNMAADSWNLVKSSTLKKAWNKILNKEKNDSGLEESSKENEECKTIKEMGRILSYEENEINEWLNSDVHDPGYQILNYKIMDEIQGERENEENKNECFENDPGPSHNEAIECLERVMKWLRGIARGGQGDVSCRSRRGAKKTSKAYITMFSRSEGRVNNIVPRAPVMLATPLKWLEWQNDADPIQVTCLRRIRDMTTLKRMFSLKQATIKSFFD